MTAMEMKIMDADDARFETVKALRAQVEHLRAAIEYTLQIQSPHLAHEWLDDWTHGDNIAMAQLNAWLKAVKGLEITRAREATSKELTGGVDGAKPHVSCK